MNAEEAERARERLFLAFELYAAGEAMMSQNLRRRHPAASDAEIEERLHRWLESSDSER
ncbi:hypothetical protein LZC95_10815 [Pendulispora brunnea]|uniref:Uncharacterized protein n=1 Tax=Pendulispora brunnea TaxID=2905690 RepID=A0ABZ2KLU0_9BACT